jgi:hypothetical protein
MRADEAMPPTRLPAALTVFLLLACVAILAIILAGRP